MSTTISFTSLSCTPCSSSKTMLEAPQPPPLHAAGVRGQGTTAHLPDIRGNLRVRMDPLVLPRHSYAADEPSPADNDELLRILCSNPRQGLRTEIRQMGRVYLQPLDTSE